MHLSTLNTVNPLRSSRHLVHWWLDDLIGSIIGARKPWGSYTQLITDNIARLLFGCSFIPILKLNVSDSTHHCNPGALSTGSLSLSWPVTFQSFALCYFLIFCSTAWLLMLHFVNVKPLVWHILVSIWTIMAAPFSEGKLFNHSST